MTMMRDFPHDGRDSGTRLGLVQRSRAARIPRAAASPSHHKEKHNDNRDMDINLGCFVAARKSSG
jgi:hypothetical protein